MQYIFSVIKINEFRNFLNSIKKTIINYIYPYICVFIFLIIFIFALMFVMLMLLINIYQQINTLQTQLSNI